MQNDQIQLFRVSLLAVLLLSFIGGCKESSTDTESSAPSSTVVMYCSTDQVYAEQIIEAFNKIHPEIEVLTRFDSETTKTTGLVQRLRSEIANPQADLFWSSEVFLTISLAKEGLLQPYTSDTTANWPTTFRDRDNHWYAFAARGRVVAYDPARTTIEPPVEWADLALPRFQDRVALADPVFGTTRGHVSAWYMLWGKDRANEFLQSLVANQIRVVSSNSQTVREVLQGTADFAITDTDDVWAAQRNGYNLRVVYPRHGAIDTIGQGTLVIPNTLAFIKGREQTPAVRALADYLLSVETERLLYQSDSHNLPVVYSDEITVEAIHQIPDPLIVDYATVAEGMDDAINAAVKILSNQ